MRTHIVVPEDLVQEVDKRVGRRKRSKFFAEAAVEKLRRENLVQTFEAAAGSMKDAGPPEWDTPEGTLQWVHTERYHPGVETCPMCEPQTAE